MNQLKLDTKYPLHVYFAPMNMLDAMFASRQHVHESATSGTVLPRTQHEGANLRAAI